MPALSKIHIVPKDRRYPGQYEGGCLGYSTGPQGMVLTGQDG